MTNAPTADKTTPTPVAQAEGQAPTVTPETEKRDYAMVSISVPHELHDQLEKAASEAKVSLSVFARRLVASAAKFDITAFERSRRKGRVKYATEEERKNAQRERAATVKALMLRYNKGEISLSDEEISAAAATITPRVAKAK